MQILAGALQYAAYLSAFIVGRRRLKVCYFISCDEICSLFTVMEMFGGLPKTIFGIWSHGFFSVGYWYIGLMAYLLRYWQYLQWSVSVLSIFYIPYIWLV